MTVQNDSVSHAPRQVIWFDNFATAYKHRDRSGLTGNAYSTNLQQVTPQVSRGAWARVTIDQFRYLAFQTFQKHGASTNVFIFSRQVIKEISEWVDGLGPGLSTNFAAAFDKAFEVLEDSRAVATSGCTKTILFLTDGTPNPWAEGATYGGVVVDSDAAFYAMLDDRAAGLGGGVRIFTYALGSTAGTAYTAEIALRNGGARAFGAIIQPPYCLLKMGRPLQSL